VTFDLGAVTIDTEIPIRSLSPERMQVVVMWPLTLALLPLTMKFPSALYLLSNLQGWTKVCCIANSQCCNLTPLSHILVISVLCQSAGMLSCVCAHKRVLVYDLFWGEEYLWTSRLNQGSSQGILACRAGTHALPRGCRWHAWN
jgi:hypothetical protein